MRVVVLPGASEYAEEVAARLEEEGNEVLLDDRDLCAGERFAGRRPGRLPARVTVGRNALADRVVVVRRRATGEARELPIAEVDA